MSIMRTAHWIRPLLNYEYKFNLTILILKILYEFIFFESENLLTSVDPSSSIARTLVIYVKVLGLDSGYREYKKIYQ